MKKKIILVAMIIVTAIAAVGCGSKDEAVSSTIMNQPTQSENVFSDITSFDALVTETLIEPMEEHTETTENRSDEDEGRREAALSLKRSGEIMSNVLIIPVFVIWLFLLLGCFFSLVLSTGPFENKDEEGMEENEKN